MSLVSFAGNLGMNSGLPQSVYQLDTNGLHQLPVKPRPLAPGQSIKLPDGAGTLTFTGYRQWISLAITYDPGQLPALIAAIAALAGLLISFLVRRRRVFVRVHAAGRRGQYGRVRRAAADRVLRDVRSRIRRPDGRSGGRDRRRRGQRRRGQRSWDRDSWDRRSWDRGNRDRHRKRDRQREHAVRHINPPLSTDREGVSPCL